jgi:hypothetical protein
LFTPGYLHLTFWKGLLRIDRVAVRPTMKRTPIYAAEWLCKTQPNCGAAAGGGVVSSGSTLLVALAGFAAGCYRMLRRARSA